VIVQGKEKERLDKGNQKYDNLERDQQRETAE
jgi:hypothetical protein